MNQKLVKTFAALAIALSFGVAASTARADGPGGAFDSPDGRYTPYIGDRVAVYIQSDGVAVWGLDANMEGVYLTKFTAAEVASGKTIVHKTVQFGTVTLVRDSAAVTHQGFTDNTAKTITTVIDTAAQYHVMWKGALGANGVGAFSKSFEATFILE